MSKETTAIYDPAESVVRGLPMRSGKIREQLSARVRQAIHEAETRGRGEMLVRHAADSNSVAEQFTAKNAEIRNLRETIHELQRQHAAALVSCARRGAEGEEFGKAAFASEVD